MESKSPQPNSIPPKNNLTALLIGIVVLLMFTPFFIAKNAAFGGADIRAKDAIREIKPGFKPWFTPLWAPPSTEVETCFFSLQSALGAGFIGYCFGYLRGQKKARTTHDPPN